MEGAEERIARVFDAQFRHFDILIAPEDVTLGAHRQIARQGWRIIYRVDPDDAGLPSLEYYATTRMTSDTHVRIWSDGHVEDLDAIREAYAYDADIPGSKEAAHADYLQHNRKVADVLAARGLYPGGDINAFLRTGGMA